MAVSTRTRFEVFKRDGFTCQYCGRKPPEVILHADHIIASSSGGKDTKDNLVTSCAGCNLGKSNVPLTDLPESLATRADQMREARAQLKAYAKLQYQGEREILKSIATICEEFEEVFPDRSLTANFCEVSLRKFLQHLTCHDLTIAMRTACARKSFSPDVAVKYFCGICWRLIKGDSRNER